MTRGISNSIDVNSLIVMILNRLLIVAQSMTELELNDIRMGVTRYYDCVLTLLVIKP